MKCYVQNGYNKMVFNAKNIQEAAIKLLKYLVKNEDEITELSPITMVSQCGFHDDILKAKMQKEYDDIQMFSTAKLFNVMGRKDIGLSLKQHEKNLPKNVCKLFEAL